MTHLKWPLKPQKVLLTCCCNYPHTPNGKLDKGDLASGCTIAGLGEVKHNGFSSAMIQGIIVSAEKAGVLYDKEN